MFICWNEKKQKISETTQFYSFVFAYVSSVCFLAGMLGLCYFID